MMTLDLVGMFTARCPQHRATYFVSALKVIPLTTLTSVKSLLKLTANVAMLAVSPAMLAGVAAYIAGDYVVRGSLDLIVRQQARDDVVALKAYDQPASDQ